MLMIGFFIAFFMLILATIGLSKTFMILIEPGNLLGGYIPWIDWNKFLMKIDKRKGDKGYLLFHFWYERLGGCILCNRQFFSCIMYWFLALITYYSPLENPASYITIGWLKWASYIIMFWCFSAISLSIGQWFEYEKREADSLKDIKEQIPVQQKAEKRAV